MREWRQGWLQGCTLARGLDRPLLLALDSGFSAGRICLHPMPGPPHAMPAPRKSSFGTRTTALKDVSDGKRQRTMRRPCASSASLAGPSTLSATSLASSASCQIPKAEPLMATTAKARPQPSEMPYTLQVPRSYTQTDDLGWPVALKHRHVLCGSGCGYRVHTESKYGSFCCYRCEARCRGWLSSKNRRKHGDNCQQVWGQNCVPLEEPVFSLSSPFRPDPQSPDSSTPL